MDTTAAKDLLRGRPDTVAIEVTSKCNLRCVYCPKADPEWEAQPHVNIDMTDDMLDELYAFCKSHGTKMVILSGVGETAMFVGWHRRLSKFLKDRDFERYLVSNFARPFTEDDLDALCKFHYIQVSFDSADRATVARLRSKADLRTIMFNIVQLKRAIRERGAGPILHVNCTLLRDNIGEIARLAGLCRELGVDRLLVGEMMRITPHNTLPAVEDLNHNEIGLLRDEIERATKLLEGSSTKLDLQDALAARLSSSTGMGRLRSFASETASQFRRKEWGACIQPWSTPWVRSDGKVFPCCISKPGHEIGDLRKNTMADIFDGEAYRKVREDLLEGKSVLPCDGCTLAQKMSPEKFRQYVHDWL